MKISSDFMKQVALLLALVTFGISAAAQNTEIKQAQRLVDIDQSGKAIVLLQESITKYPEATKLYYYLGIVQLKTGEAGKALKTFEKGVSVNAEEALNHVGLGVIRMSEKKPQEAKVFFDKALGMTKSKNVEVLQAVAQAYLMDTKNAETALKFLEKAKSINANDPKTYLLMSEIDLIRVMGGAAVSNCEKAARLDPTNGLPYYTIGLVYMRSQNYPLAEENFQKAISVDPEFTPAYKELGEMYYSMKDGVKAAKAYESFLKLKENPTEQDKTRYAFFLIMAKDYSKASEVFKPLLAKPDVSPTTVKGAAFVAVEAGELAETQKLTDEAQKQYNEAQGLFTKYLSMVPKDKIEAGDYNYIGRLFMKLKQDSVALSYFQQSLVLNQDQVEIQEKVAEMLFKAKRFPESVAAYQALIKLRKKPMSLDYYGLGRASYYNNDFAKADTAFQKLVELQPTRTIGYLWLGNTKANLDPDAKEDGAKLAFEKLIEIASPTPDAGTNKKDLITAYMYLGFYYSQRDKLTESKSYMEKVLALDPANERAKEVLRLLKEGQKQKK